MTTQTKIIGFTGGMGAGKSSLVPVFEAMGIPVLDIDKLVAEIYGDEMFCLTLDEEWGLVRGQDVKRQMSDMIAQHPARLWKLEEIIKPWLDNGIKEWIEKQTHTHTVVAIDAPLLFEAKWDKHCDFIIGLHCPRHIREQRVLLRSGMTEAKMNALMLNQLSDEARFNRCHFNISTEVDIEESKTALTRVINNIRDILSR